jgi:predicted nucleotidyltransferase
VPGYPQIRRLSWTPEQRLEGFAAMGAAMATHSAVRFALVFGSFARGEPFADVDVGVSLDEPWSYLELGELARRVEAALGRPGFSADVVSLDVRDPLLRYRVALEGVPVYERSPSSYPAFYALAILEGRDLLESHRRNGHPLEGRRHEPTDRSG